MFEKMKFNKKFYLISSYIKDKDLIADILNNSRFAKFYEENYSDLLSFINNLKLLYNSEQISNILKEFFYFFSDSSLKYAMESLDLYIHYVNKYNEENIDILKDLSFDEIKKTPSYQVKEKVLNLCFKKYYKKEIKIKGRDFLELYLAISELDKKEKLLLILKNNNLDFFAFIINELGNKGIYIDNIDEMFKNEISDKLYEPKTKEKLGERNFLKLLKEYFSDEFSYWDKKIINKLLEIENYELLKDLIQLRRNEYLKNHVDLENLNISFDDLSYISKFSIIYGYLNIKQRINFEYYDNLKQFVDEEDIKKIYDKHKETIDLFASLRDKNFREMSSSDQKKLYQYVKELKDSDKKILIEEIKKINAELKKIYKKEYANTFKKSKLILDKSKSVLIGDIKLKEEIVALLPESEYEFEEDVKRRKEKVTTKIKTKYQTHGIDEKDSVLVYNLENDEPFEFLITVMGRGAREMTPNMYGRPTHRLTIENPKKFCEDLQGGSEIISCSMIDDRCINTFLGDFADVMYVFSDIEDEDIMTVSPIDAGLSPKIEEENDLFENTSPISPKEFMRETRTRRSNGRYSYNEIAIRRKKITGEKQMPTAILCFDAINSDSVIHAKFFKVPIIVIKTKTYKFINDYTDIEKNKSRIM